MNKYFLIFIAINILSFNSYCDLHVSSDESIEISQNSNDSEEDNSSNDSTSALIAFKFI